MTLSKNMRRIAAVAALALVALTGCAESPAKAVSTPSPTVSVGTWPEESAGLLTAAQNLIDEVKAHPESFGPTR